MSSKVSQNHTKIRLLNEANGFRPRIQRQPLLVGPACLLDDKLVTHAPEGLYWSVAIGKGAYFFSHVADMHIDGPIIGF